MNNNCIKLSNFINIIKKCFYSCKKNYFSKNNFEKKDDPKNNINPNNIQSDEKIDIVIDKMDNLEDNNIRKRNDKKIDIVIDKMDNLEQNFIVIENKKEINENNIDDENFEIIDKTELEKN